MTTSLGRDPAFAASPSSPVTRSRPEGLQSGVLLELAERCEAATGPDRQLEFAIMQAVVPPEPARSLGDPNPTSDFPWPDFAPGYTASIDNALGVVPEGWEWTIFHLSLVSPKTDAAFCRHRGPDCETRGDGATPALAICAAALRARAAQ